MPADKASEITGRLQERKGSAGLSGAEVATNGTNTNNPHFNGHQFSLQFSALMEEAKELMWGAVHSRNKDVNDLVVSLDALSIRGSAQRKKIMESIKDRCPIVLDLRHLSQPISLCYDKTKRPQFFLNLDEREFYHATIARVRSGLFYFNNRKTTQDKLTISGELLGGGNWKIRVQCKPSTKTAKWEAEVELCGQKFICLIY
jgi:hypothetical protein